MGCMDLKCAFFYNKTTISKNFKVGQTVFSAHDNCDMKSIAAKK